MTQFTTFRDLVQFEHIEPNIIHTASITVHAPARLLLCDILLFKFGASEAFLGSFAVFFNALPLSAQNSKEYI